MSRIKVGVLTVLVAGVLTGCASVDRYAAPLTAAHPMTYYAQNLEKFKVQAESSEYQDRPLVRLTLARMYGSGWGVAKDISKAQYYLQKVEEDVPQLAKLARAADYNNGWKQYNTEGQNREKARQFYEEGLAMPKNGFVGLGFYLGSIQDLQGIYLGGLGVKGNPKRVYELYQLAEPYLALNPKSQSASAVRMYRAVMICRGLDPESQDKEMAREWLRNRIALSDSRFAKQQLADCK